MKHASPKEVARSIYYRWKELRDRTVSHSTLCDCNGCTVRRQLGGSIVLPYAGAPANFELKEKE